MFQKRIISSEPTIKFWQKLCKGSKERRLRDQLFQFSTDGEVVTIKIKNEGMILNPEIDFLQARLINDKQKIVVETSKFIKWLYVGLTIFILIFALLQLKNGIIATIAIILTFGLIILYNYRKINKAIINFENTLENNARLG